MRAKLNIWPVILWGVSIAGAAFLLQWFEYQYLLRRYSTETYIIVLCVLFTALGTWLGSNLFTTKTSESFTPNVKAQHALGLSSRELEVLTLLSEGQSNSELATSLHVSINTIKTHLKSIYDKLGVAQRGQAIRKARDLKLTP
jgi:DNA-binding NarL/FixJ family response regulator